jgi:hypothetical protein
MVSGAARAFAVGAQGKENPNRQDQTDDQDQAKGGV